MSILLGLLGASLVALLLVQVARKEAAAVREQATHDVEELRVEVKRREAESQVRLTEIRETERHLAAERQRLDTAMQKADARLEHTEAQRSAILAEVEQLRTSTVAALERAADLSADEARRQLATQMREHAERDAATAVRRAEAAARRDAERRARMIVASAVQRLAVPTSSQGAVTVLPLPSEEMRGRIIGKEGRNIRTFEAVTGVNVLLEDDADSVQLSSFDPERREVAEVMMRELLEDGRIHPQRIEAAFASATAGAPARAMDAGHAAAERADVGQLPPELVEAMGRLRLRTSFGQNVLEHSVETALIAAAMAAEVGADVVDARRAAFLHDVGKGIAAPGTHAALGAQLAEQAGENEVVVNAIAAHHDEVAAESVEAVLVQAADACSAARPGARRDDAAQYIDRMHRLEELVASHHGVRRVLAMSSGHEVRVVVEPSEVPDDRLATLAGEIAGHIESDLSYPGEIAVTVVRELRATATAG